MASWWRSVQCPSQAGTPMPRPSPRAAFPRVPSGGEATGCGVLPALAGTAASAGDSAQPLEEVQRGALSGEDGAQPALDPEHAIAGPGLVAFAAQGLQLAAAIERAENPRCGRNP